MSRPARGTFRQTISIHALREEGDLADLPDEQREYIISIHALREEGDYSSPGSYDRQLISIHALREEGDPQNRQHPERHRISIHALREEGDPRSVIPLSAGMYFYPRPPRGGRQKQKEAEEAKRQFLSTPSARRATYDGSMALADHEFLSTPSARRATSTALQGRRNQPISIHALREEGDRGKTERQQLCHRYFYPRPPRGGRLQGRKQNNNEQEFLSTPSARRATWPPRWCSAACPYFYPRPPRGGRQKTGRTSAQTKELFLSTPSARRATGLRGGRKIPPKDFYPRPPRGGRRLCFRLDGRPRVYFYPRPPRGGRHTAAQAVQLAGNFYPRPPRGGRREQE